MLLDVDVLLGWLSIAVVVVVGYYFYDVLQYFVVVDVSSPFFPLDVPFLSADVVLEALEDDTFVVSSLVRDEDVDLEALDVHFHSSFVRRFAMMRFLSSAGCSSMF